MRDDFFGMEASTNWQCAELQRTLPRYRHHSEDIRNQEAIFTIFRSIRKEMLSIPLDGRVMTGL
jgi:hypothetical protein